MTTIESTNQQLEVVRAKLFNICSVYKKARHGIVLVQKILFFKPKLAAVIGLLITTLDEICES